MEFYLLPMTATLVIGFLTLVLWVKTRHIGFPIGIGLIYYWSLLGSWFVIYDERGGYSGLTYGYLYEKLFRVQLDKDYRTALLLYGLFISFVLISLLAFTRSPSRKREGIIRPLQLSHRSLLLVILLANVGSYLIFRAQIEQAIEMGVSAYAITRLEPVQLFTFASVLNRIALVPGGIGLAVHLSGQRGRLIVGREMGGVVLVGYAIMLGGTYLLMVILGNRNELFFGLITAILFYCVNRPRPRVGILLVGGLGAIIAIGMIDALRATRQVPSSV